MNYLEEILNKVEENKDEMITTLQELLRIKSVVTPAVADKPFGEGVHEAYTYMMDKCRDAGFITKNVDNYGGHADIQTNGTHSDAAPTLASHL